VAINAVIAGLEIADIADIAEVEQVERELLGDI
jgi:hypothetical protein